MNQYFYIPREYDINILPAINSWTEQPNNGWTIITGVYEEGDFETGNSIIYNVDVRRIKTFIANSIIQDTKILTLVGFCLEGDLDFYAPTFKTQLLQLQGVLAFNTDIGYLQFIEILK